MCSCIAIYHLQYYNDSNENIKMNRKKYKEVKNKEKNELDIDYVSSDEESPYENPLEPKVTKENQHIIKLPYEPSKKYGTRGNTSRVDNPVVYIDVSTLGGRKLNTGEVTKSLMLGRMHFELRKDLVPITCQNFLSLITNQRGVGPDGINYHYKGTRIHRVKSNVYFQGGDLLDEQGNCSRSVYNNGSLFKDENFLLRHVGPGCLSMCNSGADSNGSLFQVTFASFPDLDDTHVVFGCFASNESFETLSRIGYYGSTTGLPIEEIRIHECGLAYPNSELYFKKMNDMALKTRKRI